MKFFNFIVLSVIIAHHSALTPHISKTHLPIFALNVGELWCSKDQSRKMGGLPAWWEGREGGSLTLSGKPKDLLNGAPLLNRTTSLYRGMRLPNAVQQ